MTQDMRAPAARIRVEIAGGVARILLNNPPLNVIDLAMAREVEAALGEIESRRDISAILFEGEGVNFSAGVDIRAHLPDRIHEMLTSFHSMIRAVIGSSKITIASVRGRCLGGGAELALVCDMAYTASDADWGFPEIKLGCFPPVAAVALPVLVGQKLAAELVLTGRQINGDEAATAGLANHSVSAENLHATVAAVLQELGQLSGCSLTHAKKALYAWDAIHFDKGLAKAEKLYLEQLISTEDAREGIIAFLEKRPPKWTGR